MRSWLVVFFLFLLPWQTRWIIAQGTIDGGVWEYGTLALYATEVFLWLLVLLHVRPLRVVFRIYEVFWQVVAGLVALAFASVAWAPDPLLAIFSFFHLLGAVLLVALLMTIPQEKRWFALGALLAGVVVQAGFALAQISLQWVHPSTFFGIAEQNPTMAGVSVVEHAGARFLRAYGGMPHPNVLGGYLAVGALMLAVLIDQMRSRRMLGVGLLAYAVLLIALFFTFSRAAWLGFVVGFFIFLYIKLGGSFGGHKICSLDKLASPTGNCGGSASALQSPAEATRLGPAQTYLTHKFCPPRLPLALIATFILVVVVFGLAFRDVVGTRLGGASRLESVSYAERSVGIRDSLALIIERPVFGVGIGNYTAALFEREPGKPAWAYQPVHVAPLLIFVELGVVGLALTLMLLMVVARSALREPMIAAFSALIVLALFDHYPWSLYPGLMLWAVIVGFLLQEAKKAG